jgi:hypothetical protein
MNNLISKETLSNNLKDYLLQSLSMEDATTDEIEGISLIANSTLDFFTNSARGSVLGSGSVLLWAIYSAIWENTISQDLIDKFFVNVNIDPSRMFNAWSSLDKQDQDGRYTVALIPGNLSDVDILDVVNALYHNKGNVDE